MTQERPRVLIEEWLPAAAIGVECMRERATGQQPPDKRFHVWWARRPLTASRAAVLGSLLPADFPKDVFERLLGFGRPGGELVAIRRRMDTGRKVPGGFGCDRAFKGTVHQPDLDEAAERWGSMWGEEPSIIDPMAGGGSIPLEAARVGLRALANEYNPVACAILEATVSYPFNHGVAAGEKAQEWGRVWLERIGERLAPFYPAHKFRPVHAYIFARTVPCPDTGHPTPLVPDWHLRKPKTGLRVVAEPIVDKTGGTWTIRVRDIGRGAGQLRTPPSATYGNGKGVSLFSGSQIPADYIKSMAQAGRMSSTLYAMAFKRPTVGLEFAPPEASEMAALQAAREELGQLRQGWERDGILPTESIPPGDKTKEPHARGILHWADMFTPRQLLCAGVLVEELQSLRPEILAKEGEELGEAVVHLLAFCLDKFLNYNNHLASWHAPRGVLRSIFDRHDYSWKPTHAEMAPCNAGSGLAWAIDSVLKAYEEIAKLPRAKSAKPVEVSLGTATNLPQISDGSITAVVVDPPYADNVQYAELADFFYVWLKRTQGHRRPEWFSTYLCDHDEEAVVNISRHRDGGEKSAKEAREEAHTFYQDLMTQTFHECHRMLRDDGVLTVMFTHKKQEAWEALFESLVSAGFTITATWPIKTESEHSLHQAKKNAAQSTVFLVARKRLPDAGIGYFDASMARELETRARASAERLRDEGLNPVDQLVGSFGPVLEIYSRYDEVRTDTGEHVPVGEAIDAASDAVSRWRVEQLSDRGLDGVEAEGQFALLCWDVLGAAEFRFNEAKLLGHAVGMDVDHLAGAGLVTKSGDKITMLSARERRRKAPLSRDEVQETLFGTVSVPRRRSKRDVLKVHPNDPAFRTTLDGCHALALRYLEVGGGSAGVGAAKGLSAQQGWGVDSPVARLMEALVNAAPPAVRVPGKRGSASEKFPEFRAWHQLLEPLFGMSTPDWTVTGPDQADLFTEEEGGTEADE